MSFLLEKNKLIKLLNSNLNWCTTLLKGGNLKSEKDTENLKIISRHLHWRSNIYVAQK